MRFFVASPLLPSADLASGRIDTEAETFVLSGEHEGLTPRQHFDSLELFQAEVAPALRRAVPHGASEPVADSVPGAGR